VADVRQAGLARVAHLDGHHRVMCGQGAERLDPLLLVAEVGDEDDEPRRGGDAPKLHERVRERALVALALAVGGDAARQRTAHRDGARLRRARRQQPRLARAERAQRDTAGTPHRQTRHHDRRAVGHVALQSLGRSERH
jgi:hypothetical protein